MFINPERDITYFGRTNFRNQNRLFGVKRRDRRQHMYIIGKTGVGKTALLSNLAVQDIAAGSGLCVIDPHGEFVEGLLEKIPRERLADVIYFNPEDPDYHLGFNVLELPDPKYKNLVASGLMGIFTKIWANVWSARMEYIMNNAVLALLDTPGSTLLGINRILVDKDYRQQIVGKVKDPVVKAFWLNEYEQWRDQFRNEAIAPIQNKVGQFLSTAMVRNIVGQSKSTIDIFEIMNTSKIFLVNVSKGRIGEDNSALLGAMLITKIQLAAMERVRIPEEERVDFSLYVDEFQNFATDSFAGILSESRKYRLNLVLAHQYVGQLVTMGTASVSTKVRDAVFGNVGTMIVFRVGATDAEFLEKEFEPEFMIQDMVGLPNYHVYLKLMVDGLTSRPFSASTLPPISVLLSDPAEIIKNSQENYCCPRIEVEEEINSWSGIMTGEGRPAPISPPAFGPLRSREGAPSEARPGRRSSFGPTSTRFGEAGEAAGLGEAGEAGQPRREDMATLASLGIEFSRRPVERLEKPISSPVVKRILEEVPRKIDKDLSMSLTELKPVESDPASTRSPYGEAAGQGEAASKRIIPRDSALAPVKTSIEDLRQAINQSLNEFIKEPPLGNEADDQTNSSV